jgi:hypothetical protein
MSKDAFVSNSDDEVAALSAYDVAPNARGEAHEWQLPLCS